MRFNPYPPEVFRVQDAAGRGPWKPGFSHRWVEDRDDHDNLLPWLTEIGPVHQRAIVGMSIGCGCLTLSQLRRWFSRSEYRTLAGMGYAAVLLRGCHVLGASGTQCVFERVLPLNTDAEPVELYD